MAPKLRAMRGFSGEHVGMSTGHVAGYALTGFPKPSGGEGGGWRGHFALAVPGSITAYALLDDGQLICRHLAAAP
jgi:hypothetical protein